MAVGLGVGVGVGVADGIGAVPFRAYEIACTWAAVRPRVMPSRVIRDALDPRTSLLASEPWQLEQYCV